jgi:DNA-directed RNA polymerase specialized sigma24 family protein
VRGYSDQQRDEGIMLRVPLGGRCSDCELRNALTLTGRPRIHPELGFNLTAECHSCGGSGIKSAVVRLDARALDLLSPKQRFVIERRFGLLDGRRYKQREIAEAMGVDQPAVSYLEKRARARLVALATPKRHEKRHIST